jgi:HTH-type transcriptional regulator, competence development regulator
MEDLGALLRRLRGDLSLREVSEMTGISHTYISDLERYMRKGSNREINPSPRTLKKLARVYNYSMEDLLKRAGYLDEVGLEETEDGKRAYDLNAILTSHSEVVMWKGKKLSEAQRQKIVSVIEWVLTQDEEMD